MNEPILAAVRRRLSESRGKWADVARDSGVPYHTLTKIAQGVSPNPRIDTVQRLVDYFGGGISAISQPASPTHRTVTAR